MSNYETIKFTIQTGKERFLSWWGCFWICLVNIVEVELGRALKPKEFFMVLGYCYAQANVLMSNFKDHELVWAGLPELKGWSSKADPEPHFWILNQFAVLKDIMNIMDIYELTHKYVILECELSPEDDTPNTHFKLAVDEGFIINPDPSLDGPVIARREVN